MSDLHAGRVSDLYNKALTEWLRSGILEVVKEPLRGLVREGYRASRGTQ